MASAEDEATVEIAECMGIGATDDSEGRVIMLGFLRKGVALLLTYDEALALNRVLGRIVQATTQHAGGKNGYGQQ